HGVAGRGAVGGGRARRAGGLQHLVGHAAERRGGGVPHRDGEGGGADVAGGGGGLGGGGGRAQAGRGARVGLSPALEVPQGRHAHRVRGRGAEGHRGPHGAGRLGGDRGRGRDVRGRGIDHMDHEGDLGGDVAVGVGGGLGDGGVAQGEEAPRGRAGG